MEELENNEQKDRREEIFSETVRAGKRTYFFDVKETRAEEKYLTITESKRRFSNEQGKFFYEKHKIFLYREDFQKFIDGLNGAIGFIETGKAPEANENSKTDETAPGTASGLEFEDLGATDNT